MKNYNPLLDNLNAARELKKACKDADLDKKIIEKFLKENKAKLK